jgi:hypothetical protein
MEEFAVNAICGPAVSLNREIREPCETDKRSSADRAGFPARIHNATPLPPPAYRLSLIPYHFAAFPLASRPNPGYNTFAKVERDGFAGRKK